LISHFISLSDLFKYPQTTVDWFALGVLALGVVWGLMKGLVRELMSVAAWVFAFTAAPLFSKTVGSLIPAVDMSESVRDSVGYVLVFVGVLVLGTFLAQSIRRLVDFIGLGLLDRILGGAFAMLGALVVLMLGTICVNMSPFKGSPEWTHSNSAPVLEHALSQVAPILSSELRKVN
jgi:membrane protein required for colicin V production